MTSVVKVDGFNTGFFKQEDFMCIMSVTGEENI